MLINVKKKNRRERKKNNFQNFFKIREKKNKRERCCDLWRRVARLILDLPSLCCCYYYQYSWRLGTAANWSGAGTIWNFESETTNTHTNILFLLKTRKITNDSKRRRNRNDPRPLLPANSNVIIIIVNNTNQETTQNNYIKSNKISRRSWQPILLKHKIYM